MASIDEKKGLLRKQCLVRREQITTQEWEMRSGMVIDRILESREYARAKVIHCFVSMDHRKEVQTMPLLRRILSDQKVLLVPVTNVEEGVLEHARLTDLSELRPGKWGVPEPERGDPEPDPEPDLILVPLLAVDRNGNRLGYGKGFYDRFLSRSQSDAFGVLFSDFITEHVPVDSHDEPLTGFFTENGVSYSKHAENNDVHGQK